MSDDLEREIRSRLKRAELPEAPRALQARAAAVVTTNPAASGRASELGRHGRFLLPLVAVLVIGATAILGTGTGPRPIVSDVPATPARSAEARLSVDAAVFEWCSPGGCEFHVSLAGPGGPWLGRLEFANLGEQAPIAQLPGILATGTYSLRSEIHVFGDTVYEGETGPRDLGTTAICTSDFEVLPDTRVVAVTLGFWLDRCAAGTVTTDDASRLATLIVQPSIEGVCGGAGGCDYRLELSGPGGTWAAMPGTVKPASQLVISELVSMLPPGSYRLTASSHRMSEEPAPGAGHQTEFGVAATCSADFVITSETGNVNADVTFVGETCSASADVQVTPTSTPAIVGPVPSPRIACKQQYDGPGLVLTCDAAVAAVEAALGTDHPPIKRMEFTYGCRDVGAGDCAAQLSGFMEVLYDTVPTGVVILYVASDGRFSGAEIIGPYPDPTFERSFSPPYGTAPPAGHGIQLYLADLSADRRTLTVEFPGQGASTPDGPCSTYDEPWVAIDGETLRVAIISVYVPSPSACLPIAGTGSWSRYHLALPEPFTGTTIKDVGSGTIFEIAPG